MSAKAQRADRAPRYRLEIAGREFDFETRPGVFSGDAVDAGTLLLLESVLKAVRPHQNVLDLGTGAGILGVAIAPLLTRGEVWMVDADIRATRLAQRNVEVNGIRNASVIIGDVTLDLPKGVRFDLVAQTHPLMTGATCCGSSSINLTAFFVPGAPWVVANRLLSLKDMMHESFGNVEIVDRKKGFLVLCSRKEKRPHGGRISG